MTHLLSSIVLVFLLCHSTKVVTNTYEAYQMIYFGELVAWPPWAELMSRWNHLMLAVNASTTCARGRWRSCMPGAVLGIAFSLNLGRS